MVRQKVLAVLFCGFVAAQQIAQEYPQQQGQPANIAVNLPPVAPARNSVPPAPINAQGQPDAAGNPQIPVKQIPSHDQNQIPPQPQVPQYQNIPQNSQAQQKSVTPQPLPGAGAPRGMPVNQQHHQMQRNHIPQQPIAAHPEAANIPPAQMAQIPLQQHQGQQMGIPQGQQIYPPGNVGGVGHAAIPPQMQPPLHPAQMAAMQAAYQNAGSQQHPLYGNDSRVGPIAPHEMNVDQIRQLEAAEGLYPNGGLPENGAGDTAAQWEAMMADFVPDMIVTFKLSGGSTEHFHQEVGPEATLIRGGFFESMTENGAAVSFTVISPSGKVAYTSKAGEGIFKFETKEPGQYTFAVHNAGWYVVCVCV
eukprot:Gregarina_sp_Poly_1__4093@NODE_2245_length_2417_cov_121_274468_g1441_i0_p1_GENE_NODE_2245_length_2417_cov_121_274468_g1441_i0NODE_2245_length_2417_cov_121_274468_g1441_i0_p1_ORF_typecomplete_len362_score55_71EMP24_GP25L/PF01105_24/1_6e07_NODE_2245_length_2417_cov_121_274468_g1441_i01401225